MHDGLMGCDQEGGFKDSKWRGGTNIMKDGTVDLLQGSGVNVDLYPCMNGHHPK
jgi:hypothetical protein